LIKNYDIVINYHLGKDNLVVDALSHKRHYKVTLARRMRLELCGEIGKLNHGMVNDVSVTLEIESTLEEETRKGQLQDEKLKETRQLIKENKTSDFSEDSQGTCWRSQNTNFMGQHIE
jgi:hypothetical protein